MANGKGRPLYEEILENELDLERRFKYRVTVDGQVGHGLGGRIQQAKAEAAKEVLCKLLICLEINNQTAGGDDQVAIGEMSELKHQSRKSPHLNALTVEDQDAIHLIRQFCRDNELVTPDYLTGIENPSQNAAFKKWQTLITTSYGIKSYDVSASVKPIPYPPTDQEREQFIKEPQSASEMLYIARQRKMDFIPPPGQDGCTPMFYEVRSMFIRLPTKESQREQITEIASILSGMGIHSYRIADYDHCNVDRMEFINKALRQLFSNLNLFQRLRVVGLNRLVVPLLPTKNRKEFVESGTSVTPDAIIGKGGFAIVKKVSNIYDNQEYAIKEIDFRSDLAGAQEETFKEVRLYAMLSHSNIVSYKSTWTDEVGYTRAKQPNTITDSELSYMTSSISQQSTSSLNDKDDSTFEIDYYYCNLPKVGTDLVMYMGTKVDGCLEEVTYQLMARLNVQMELCDGNLAEKIEQRNESNFRGNVKLTSFDVNLSLNSELKTFRHILKGVAFLHQNSVLHRDLKPSNVLLSFDGRYKIADFGLSCRHKSGVVVNDAVSQRSEEHTTGLGTPLYAAPEILAGQYNYSADMYSLGVILFELVFPFSSAMDKAKCMERAKQFQCLPDELVSTWPLIAELILALISSEPNKRPTASGVLNSDLFSKIK